MAEDLSFAEGAEGLRRLAKLLRREMPEGFAWDFTHLVMATECGAAGCALGLAYHAWPEMRRACDHESLRLPDVAQCLFRLSHGRLMSIFYGAHGFYQNRPLEEVQPEEVADAIDAYLKAIDYPPEQGEPHAL